MWWQKEHYNKSDIPTNPEFNIGGDGYYSQNKEFIKSLSGDKSNLVSMREGMEVQRVIDAIYRSAKVGCEVKL